ncbi:glutamine amidotransferase [Alsobacter metallidurans]|uniref:Glutamine amidotransferase n=1 Tax=Alsobacter metallidurans TaxID=340221 RepID=A0A917IBZ2_9HYPH|nr:glutamine amidotransferase [Alsobacter metallidurans]GGH32810.1 glutamine amidotransferase [Alsobacter metallidurans]
MSKRILIVLHQEHSTPGRVGRLLQERGYALDIRRTPLGQPLPDTMDEHDGAVVFGGPMSANDEHPWVKDQIDWIGSVLRARKPYLGLCLGAQMLVRQLGGRVDAHPEGHAEIGYYALRPTDKGQGFSQEIGAPWPGRVYQWHREGFDMPGCCEPLAEGDIFPHQAFRCGERAFGLQFHPEVTYAMMCRWTVRAHERMAMPGARPRHEHLQGWHLNDPQVRTWLDAFLDHWLSPPAASTAPTCADRAAAADPARMAEPARRFAELV